MLLDLYVTHWNESWEIGEKGFQMIRLQRGLDWKEIRITVVHDGTDPFPEEYFRNYPCEIRQVTIPHGGIAAARNWCIDDSVAEWIKWNDYDDMLANIYALRDMMHTMKHNAANLDAIWFDVCIEDCRGKVPVMLVNPKRDPVVLHGKAFRVSWLREHGMRFQEDLTWCEDSAFLALMEMEIDLKRYGYMKTDAPVYCSICRDGSLCNRPEIRFQNLQAFFRRHCYVQEEMRKHGKMDGYYTMTARIMTDSYMTLHRAGITEDMSEHERRVREYWKKHRGDLGKLQLKLIQDVIAASNRENPGLNLTTEELFTWLRKLNEEEVKADV